MNTLLETNPVVGDVVKGKVIGRSKYEDYIFSRCPNCAKTRWLVKRKSSMENQLCPSCSNKTKQKRVPSISKDMQNAIKVLYISGLSSNAISKRTGLRIRLVTTALRRMKITRSFRDAALLGIKEGRIRQPRGSKSPSWKGGRVTDKGYVYVYCPEHPRATKTRPYVGEHILVWEKANSRKLPDEWVVHHSNGIKDDNRPENLIAYPKKKHAQLIPEMTQRIRELEKENALLKTVLSENYSRVIVNNN